MALEECTTLIISGRRRKVILQKRRIMTPEEKNDTSLEKREGVYLGRSYFYTT